MTMPPQFIRYFVFVTFILSTPTAWAVAAECARFDTPPIANCVEPRQRLNALEQNGCLGGDLDDNALTRAVTAALSTAGTPQAPGVSDEERRQSTAQALEQVAQSAATQRAAPSVGKINSACANAYSDSSPHSERRDQRSRVNIATTSRADMATKGYSDLRIGNTIPTQAA